MPAAKNSTQTSPFCTAFSGKSDSPFGMMMPARKYNDGSYRFGFNGKEMDNEVYSSSGSSYDFGARIYSSRLGKFLSVDPLFRGYPWFTPYQFAANMPIMATDLDGLEAKLAIWGSGNGDEGTFSGRADRFSTNPKIGHTTIHQIATGKDFIDLLKTQTNNEGSVASVIIFSHSGPDGIYLQSGNGFYDSETDFGGGPDERDISNVVSAIESGDIRVEDNAVFIFAGCNCAGDEAGNESAERFSQEFTSETGIASIASVGNVSPEIIGGKETGKLISDVGFYKFERSEDGSLNVTSLGKKIDPTDFDVDITIPKMKPKIATHVSRSDAPEN